MQIDQEQTIAIQQTQIQEVKTVASFKIHITGMELFKGVTVVATLFDENGNHVGNRMIEIKDQDYLAWNNDDQYIVDFVARKLGFVLASIES